VLHFLNTEFKFICFAKSHLRFVMLDGVSPGLVMNQVLARGRILGRIGLGLPVQQGPAQALFIGLRVTFPVQHDAE
jgi:hypothetical protein